MSGLKDTIKSGWHPKGKDGKSSESWRGDFKGINQVAGWVGKGKDKSSTSAALDHISRPLSTLKDPALFGPPPKNVNYHGGAALPSQITPDKSGLGATLSQSEMQARKQADEERLQQDEEEARNAAAPPAPFRVDTTGLSTTHLPPPPGRKDGAGGTSAAISPKPKPSLPPRLPPREGSSPGVETASKQPTYTAATTEPPAHKGILNQDALSRLGASGISVPGFGIGGKQASSLANSGAAPSPSFNKNNSPDNSHLSEIQSRFSRLSKSDSSSEAPAQGTSFAQKQAAFRTASAFRNDPGSISLSDARNAASTANNFRERHGDQVATGLKSASSLNQKYGLMEKVGKYSSEAPTVQSPAIPIVEMQDKTITQKKAPPPPLKKKPELIAGFPNGSSPPPIPLASKPKPKMSDI